MSRFPWYRENLCLKHFHVNPSLSRKSKYLPENSSKIQSSHGKVEEKKIIPTIPIDMIGIKGYDKRNTKEARQ